MTASPFSCCYGETTRPIVRLSILTGGNRRSTGRPEPRPTMIVSLLPFAPFHVGFVADIFPFFVIFFRNQTLLTYELNAFGN